VYTYIIYITLNYKRTPRIEVAYTSYLTSNLNIFIGKTLVPSFSVLFTYIKILRAKNSLSSLPSLYYGNIIALFYKKLKIGSWLILV